jgi:hypothetical protein
MEFSIYGHRNSLFTPEPSISKNCWKKYHSCWILLHSTLISTKTAIIFTIVNPTWSTDLIHNPSRHRDTKRVISLLFFFRKCIETLISFIRHSSTVASMKRRRSWIIINLVGPKGNTNQRMGCCLPCSPCQR